MQIIVNGEQIPNDVFQHELQTMQQQNPGIPEEIASEQVQQRIIEWTLIRQNAKKEDIPVWTGEIDAEFEKLCQAHGGKQAFFQRFGMTDKDEGRVKGDIELNLKTQRFLDLVSKDVAEPAEEAIQQFYEENKMHFIKPEQAHVVHIVKHPKTEQEAEKASTELREVRQQLLDGADFMEVASKVSECTDTSPDLGLFTKGQMSPAFEFVVFSMNVGEISPVFQTQFGLHIATVLEKKPASQLELAECCDDIKERLFQGLKNDAIAAWVNTQKADASVEITED
ncbi:peptidylprolyl isomerase [Verrucomicrobiota bacterium]